MQDYAYRKDISNAEKHLKGAAAGGKGKGDSYKDLEQEMQVKINLMTLKYPHWPIKITDEAAKQILINDKNGNPKPISGRTIRNYIIKPKK